MRVINSGAIEVWTGGVWSPLASAGALVEGEWHHLGFVWDGQDVTAYVNGVEQLTATSNFNFDASLDPGQEFGLGRTFNNAFGAYPDGIFDDVSIWDGFLDADQIMDLANGTSPLDIILGSTSDRDGDGDVDGADFLILQRVDPASIPQWETDFGTILSSAAGAGAVPEPTALVMALLGGVGLALAARRMATGFTEARR